MRVDYFIQINICVMAQRLPLHFVGLFDAAMMVELSKFFQII
jgi:hypothetical protein